MDDVNNVTFIIVQDEELKLSEVDLQSLSMLKYNF